MNSKLDLKFKVTDNPDRFYGMINDTTKSLENVKGGHALQNVFKNGIEKADTQEEAEYFIAAFLDNLIQILECYNIWSARA